MRGGGSSMTHVARSCSSRRCENLRKGMVGLRALARKEGIGLRVTKRRKVGGGGETFDV